MHVHVHVCVKQRKIEKEWWQFEWINCERQLLLVLLWHAWWYVFYGYSGWWSPYPISQFWDHLNFNRIDYHAMQITNTLSSCEIVYIVCTNLFRRWAKLNPLTVCSITTPIRVSARNCKIRPNTSYNMVSLIAKSKTDKIKFLCEITTILSVAGSFQCIRVPSVH